MQTPILDGGTQMEAKFTKARAIVDSIPDQAERDKAFLRLDQMCNALRAAMR